MSQASPPPARDPWGRRIDRALTPLLRLLGRAWGRPGEGLLNRLTGRSRGGEPDPGLGEASAALAAGRRALEAGQLGEALHLFSVASERAPEDPWAWHGRGDAFQLSGRSAAALEAYEAALERAPELALAHNGRGNALEGLGRLSEAAEAWRRALSLDPSLPWPKEGLARLKGGPNAAEVGGA